MYICIQNYLGARIIVVGFWPVEEIWSSFPMSYGIKSSSSLSKEGEKEREI